MTSDRHTVVNGITRLALSLCTSVRACRSSRIAPCCSSPPHVTRATSTANIAVEWRAGEEIGSPFRVQQRATMGEERHSGSPESIWCT